MVGPLSSMLGLKSKLYDLKLNQHHAYAVFQAFLACRVCSITVQIGQLYDNIIKTEPPRVAIIFEICHVPS